MIFVTESKDLFWFLILVWRGHDLSFPVKPQVFFSFCIYKYEAYRWLSPNLNLDTAVRHY